MSDAPFVPLTLERLRADIAKALHESPEAIGLDDNLIDLGLDSMRAMTLVVGWSGGGIEYEFSEFAAVPTLEGWWQVVARRQAHREPR